MRCQLTSQSWKKTCDGKFHHPICSYEPRVDSFMKELAKRFTQVTPSTQHTRPSGVIKSKSSHTALWTSFKRSHSYDLTAQESSSASWSSSHNHLQQPVTVDRLDCVPLHMRVTSTVRSGCLFLPWVRYGSKLPLLLSMVRLLTTTSHRLAGHGRLLLQWWQKL